VLPAALISGIFGLLNASLEQRPEGLEDRLKNSTPENPYKMTDLAPEREQDIRSTVEALEQLFEKGAAISQVETFYRMDNYYYATENYKKAIELYENATEIRPDWAKSHIAMGINFEALRDFNRAAESYKAAGANSLP
jgi:tetratricopeptide (TPR) repeat protein